MSNTEEMACIELIEVVSDYLGGTLSEDERSRFEQHLEKCPYCVEYVSQFRETVDAMGRLSLDSIPSERRRHLLEAFRGWSERKRQS